MSLITGNKSRANRERRKKIERRVVIRALRAELAAKAAPTPPVRPSEH